MGYCIIVRKEGQRNAGLESALSAISRCIMKNERHCWRDRVYILGRVTYCHVCIRAPGPVERRRAYCYQLVHKTPKPG